MTAIIYNICVLVGLLLIGSGVALVNVPAALVTVGSLILGLTVFAANLTRKG